MENAPPIARRVLARGPERNIEQNGIECNQPQNVSDPMKWNQWNENKRNTEPNALKARFNHKNVANDSDDESSLSFSI